MSEPKPAKPKMAPGQPAKADAFDVWLKRGLHQIYDDVASEPIPEALRKLIEDDRKA